MSRVEDLPPDLRAVLSLLLGRHKHYGEIAAMLSIEEHAVHDRAHSALALLAPRQARGLSAAQREQVGEYLLSQAPKAEQSAAVAYLESSAAARAWALALATELAPLSTEELPGIPVGGSTSGGPLAEGAAPNGGALPAAGAHTPAPPGVSPAANAPQAPSSRRGGALLLGGLAVVVVVAVALIVGLGGGSSPSSATTSSTPSESGGSTSAATTTPSTTSTTTTTKGKSGSGKASEPHLTATLPLEPANTTTSKALGLVEVIAEGNEHAFILAAEHLPPTNGFHYAAWLYNTPTDAYFLGGGTTVSSKGTLKAAQALPRNAAHYATIILTEEHEEQPTQPGPIVLSGAFKLG